MPLRLIQITDCHLFADAATRLKDISTRERLEKVLQALQMELPRVDRLIVTGDLTHDERVETYQALRNLLKDWLPRLRVLPGNHDDRALMRQIFGDVVQTVGDRNVFAESSGNWRLIGLDTQITGSLSGEVGSEQLAWLERQLAASPLPTALFLHHHPLPIGSLWLEKIILQDAASLWQLLDRFPQVRVLCGGHVHQEWAVLRGSTLVLTTPSTGVQFRPETETLVVDDAPPAYRILDLADDGGVQSRVIRVPAL